MEQILPTRAILPSIFFQQHYSFRPLPPSRVADPLRPESGRKLTEDITMSTRKELGSAQTKKVELELPEGLYDLMEKVCEIQRRSVNDYLINSAVVVLDGDLDMCLADLPDLGIPSDQRAYVESLAWPEEVEAEGVTA